MDADPEIKLTDVGFSWPGTGGFHIAIDAFAVERGESILLLGESGSGKSTLLSLISGIFPPERGSIFIGDTDVASLAASRRDRFRAENIGVIFQMFNLLPNVTALDNVVLPLHFAPARRANLKQSPRREALAMLDALGLPGEMVKKGPARRLSVGQQQRVAVARALIGAPRLIVADEPTSALDASSQNAFLDLLFDQVAAARSTLLMVSHDRRLAERFQRTVDLADIATIRQDGTS